MGRNAIVVDARERAILLIRLACIALGSTLVLLAGTGVLSLAAAILLLYLAGAVVMRYSPAVQRAPFLAGAIDLVAVTALTFAFPLTFAPWVLYTFAIGAAALRFGAIGAIAATAFAIVGFDLSLAARAAEARAADLWPVQALIAIGLVTAEIAWVLGRADPTVTSAAAGALAALVHVREPDALLRATVTEIARVPGVRGVWVWQRGPDHRLRTTITSGVGPSAELGVEPETLRRLQSPVTLDRVLSGANGVIVPVSAEPPLSVGVDLADVPEDQRQATTATVNDLLGRVAPLVAAAFERSRLTDDSTALVALGSAIASVTGERTQAGALAALAIEAGRIVQGHAGIVRVADGSTLTGDVDGPAIAEVARDRRLPTIATVKGAGFAVLSIGEGRVLAARGEHEVLAGRITHLERLGLAGRERLALLEERDEYQRAAREAIGRARVSGAREIALEAPSAPVPVAIDPARFAQLLDNLLGNAVKYSPPGAPIDVRIASDDHNARVSVVDRGVGIAPEHLERIFERFYRAPGPGGQVTGQGLGLSICKEIVTAHGGDIHAESAGPSHGSTFTFSLPL